MSFGQPTEEVFESTLTQIVPEQWKNIPVCLTSSLRIMLDACMGIEKRHDELIKSIEEQKKKYQF